MPKLNLNFKRFIQQGVVPDKLGYFDEVKYKGSSILKALWKLFVLKTY